MRRLNLSLLAFVAALLCQNGYAVDTTILGNEPEATPIDSSPNRTVHSGLMSMKDRDAKWEELSIRLKGGLGYDGYIHGSDRGGTGVALENERGLYQGLEIRFRPKMSWITIFGSANRISEEYTPAPSSKINPKVFNVNRREFNLGLYLYPYAYFNGEKSTFSYLGLGVGYSWRTRESVNSVPVVAVTTLDQGGLFYRLNYARPLGEKFSIDSYLEYFMPSKYSERSNATGYYNSASAAEAYVSFGYRLFSAMEIALGAYYRYEMAQFSSNGQRSQAGGGGARGVDGFGFSGPVNGHEKNKHFGFPVELRFFL